MGFFWGRGVLPKFMVPSCVLFFIFTPFSFHFRRYQRVLLVTSNFFLPLLPRSPFIICKADSHGTVQPGNHFSKQKKNCPVTIPLFSCDGFFV